MRPSSSFRILLAPAVLAGALLALASPVLSAPVADQENSMLPTGNFTSIFNTSTPVQTFTVGFDGVLSSVSIVVDPRGTPVADLTLEVQATTAGAANGTVLASASVAPFAGPNPTVNFDVSAASLSVTAGEVLAIVLKSTATAGNDYLLRIVPSNRYASGEATGTGLTSGSGWDAIFKTFVVPTSQPGPGTVDQSNTPSPTSNFAAILSGLTATQTFTVGTTGTLTRIDVMVDPRGNPVLDLQLEVQATTSGAANGTVLARSIVTPFAGPNPMVAFDVSAYGLAVSAGEQLAFVLKSNAPGGTDYLMRGVPGFTYAGGEMTNSTGGFATGAGWDAIFQTYVEGPTTAVGPWAGGLGGRGLRLESAMPNPVRATTLLRFAMPAAGVAHLDVFDASGRRVRTLVDEWLSAGGHEVRWDRRSDRGEPVPAGVYFTRLVSGGAVSGRRMAVID